jgi:hypothetical protein
VLVLTSYLAGLFGRPPLDIHKFSSILTESPYYPVQVGLALLLGFTLGGILKHRSMSWVWIIPAGILGTAMISFLRHGQIIVWALPVISSESVWSHFFAWGCLPHLRCIDQLDFTMPFYSAVSYSLGGHIGTKTSK